MIPYKIQLAIVKGEGFLGTNDLTQGSVWRQLIKYAAPMVASSILQAAYSMADLIIAGRFVGSNGISGVNNASQLMLMLTQIIIGITTGGNIVIGQFFGSRDDENRAKTATTLFSMSMLLGVIFSLIFYIFSPFMLKALGAPAFDEANAYLKICSLGVLSIFGYNAMSAIIRGVGNSKQPFYFIAVTAVLNIILDIIFMGPLQMGTAGAAAATALSQAVSFIASLVYVLKNYDTFFLSLRRLFIRADKLKAILKLGIPCALQMTIGGISWLSVTYIINQYGVHVSAGNGISVKIKDFCQLFVTAMASSAATMIAQNLGAAKYDRAREVMYTAMKITISMSLVLIAVIEIFAPQMVSVFTNNPEDAAAAVANLRIEIIGQVFYAVFLVYHSLAIGAGHTLFAMGSSFVNCILVRIVLAFVLNHYFGIMGLYFACMIAPSSSVPLGFLYERSNIWRRTLAGKEQQA